MSKLPSPLEKPLLDERIAALRAQGIHSVLATFTDLLGVPKGKLVPLLGLAVAVEAGAGFSGPSIAGTGLPRMGARSEYMGRVRPESLRPLPFMPGVAHAVCDGFAGGEPLDTCPRQVLQHQVARLKARGWTLWVGIEPEFFLLQRDAQGRWQVADADDRLAKPSYDLSAIGRNFGFLDAMRQTLDALGFELQQIDHEDASGQYEINYRHDDALAAADRYQLFKLATQAVAQQHGLVFSTMPKPLAHAPGSGLHFHLSLTDEKGNAVMADPAGTLGLSETGRQFAAGLLHHADALAALCAPTVNSYKRLGHHLVAGVEGRGRQQPNLPGAHGGGTARMAPSGPLLQRLRRTGRHAGRGARWHRPGAADARALRRRSVRTTRARRGAACAPSA